MDPNDTPTTEPVDDFAADFHAAQDELTGVETETTEVVQQEQVQEVPPLEAPQHWDQQARELFATRDRETQEWLLARHRAMEGDYTKKMQAHADAIRYAEQTRSAWNQVAQHAAHLGMDEAGVQRMAQAYLSNYLQNPQQFVHWLAQQVGYQPPQPDEYQSPEAQRLAAIERQIGEQRAMQQWAYQQHQNMVRQAQEEQLRGEIQSELGAFESAKDAKGNLKHPLMQNEQARELIASHMAQTGASLEESYSRVAAFYQPQRPNPDKVRNARLAASSVQGRGDSDAFPDDLREHLRAEFRRMA